MIPHFWFKEFGARLVLGSISGYEYQKDETTGEFTLDAVGNQVPTGKFKVELLDRLGEQFSVPAIMAMAGNSVFAGGLPEVGSVCLIGYRDNNVPIILGFIPHSLPRLITARKEIPNLQPGEFLIQGSDTYTGGPLNETPELGPQVMAAPQFFSGARIKWDKYGRLIITARNYECIFGPVLSDEYSSQIAVVNDPITGNRMIFRERIVEGAVERRVDEQGNVVAYFEKDLHLIVDGAFNVILKEFNFVGREGATLSDRFGNKISVDSDGNVAVESIRGSVTIFGGSNVNIQAGGNIEEAALRSKTETVADVFSRSVGADLQDVVGLSRFETTGLNRVMTVLGANAETVQGVDIKEVTGDRTVTVAGVDNESVFGAKTVNVTGAYTIIVNGVAKVLAADIQLGVVAIERIVKETMLKLKYNTHSHLAFGAPPTNLLDDADFNQTIKVGP